MRRVLKGHLTTTITNRKDITGSGFAPFFVATGAGALCGRALSNPPIDATLAIRLALCVNSTMKRGMFSALAISTGKMNAGVGQTCVGTFHTVGNGGIGVRRFVHRKGRGVVS